MIIGITAGSPAALGRPAMRIASIIRVEGIIFGEVTGVNLRDLREF